MTANELKNLWSIYNGLIKKVIYLDANKDKTQKDNLELIDFKDSILKIENLSFDFMKNNYDYTLENIFKFLGTNASVIIDFVPGSEGYKKFGFQKSFYISFSEEEVTFLRSNIENNIKQHGILKFKTNDDFTEEQCNTFDILQMGIR